MRHTRPGGPGSADRAPGPGIETRAAVRAASSQAGTVQGPQGLPPVKGPLGRAQPAALQGTTRKTRRRRARLPSRGRGKLFESRAGPRYLEPRAGHAFTRQLRQSTNLNQANPGRAPRHGRTRPQHSGLKQTSLTRITTARCNSGQAQSVKFEPLLPSNVTHPGRAGAAEY